MIYDCIIVGGGASGLCCAASLNVNNGLILEAGARPGAKLLLSGGGRCNVTHAGSIKDFIPLYGDCGRRLRSILYSYSNSKLVAELESSGVPCISESDGRIFPLSGRSSDMLNLLLRKSAENGWSISTDSKLVSIHPSEHCPDQARTVRCKCARRNSSLVEYAEYSARNIIIACGGITYPRTGSDGSAFDILQQDLGVNIISPRSALAPIRVENYPYSELAGVAVDNAAVSLHAESGKRLAETRGSLLFAHRELSGPAIINMSRHIVHNIASAYENDGTKSASPKMLLRIDYSNSISLPKRLVKLRNSVPVSSKKNPTHRIGESVDEFVVSSVSADGIVTVGGVSLDEIDTKTMALKSYPDIYVIGEALDADGPTGGYNLQLCYSTAKAAASSITASYPRL